MTTLLAVVVLYKQTPQESSALRALLAMDAAIQSSITLFVYDNSPETQKHLFTAYPAVRYVHDPANGRILAAYRAALSLARELDAQWLMLLDQDTEITPAYVEEGLRLTEQFAGQLAAGVCAFTPRLMIHGEQSSPHALAGDGSNAALRTGRSAERLTAWNSGALVRVSSLLAIGGFPAEFPLDNLDYAVFFKLQQGDERVYVMESRLEHNLSVADVQTLSFGRLRDKLASDLLFQRRFQQRSRLSLAAEFFMTGVSLLRKLSDKRMGFICFRYGARCLAGR